MFLREKSEKGHCWCSATGNRLLLLQNCVFFQTKHSSDGGVTGKNIGGVETELKESSLVPSGLGGIVQTENEVKRAISASVWGPGLSVRLSGCRVRGMDLEC